MKSYYSRRAFLRGTSCLLASANFTPLSMQAYSSDRGLIDPVDLEIVALGHRFHALEPDTAAKLLTDISNVAQLPDVRELDWSRVHKARIYLTSPQRIHEELSRGNVFFADGWLLTHSELGVALLYAAVYCHLSIYSRKSSNCDH